jgi:hypothetical protein
MCGFAGAKGLLKFERETRQIVTLAYAAPTVAG